MTGSAVLMTVSLGLAALVGFSAQRASLCTVKAVAEILSTRRAYMLASFAKTVLWVMLVTLAFGWLMPPATNSGWSLTVSSLAGGLMFGMGAATNGGCAFSTLTRLAAGRLSMLLTLAGLTLGLAAHARLTALGWAAPPTPVAVVLAPPPAPVALLLLAALTVWALREARRLWRTRPSGTPFRRLALSSPYRLSTAALLMGLSNAVIHAAYGAWAYTSVLDRGVSQAMGEPGTIAPIYGLLFAALVAGMALSALQSGGFRLRWRPSRRWGLRFLGGLMMGLGAGMVPGGNDALILNFIPGLSPHAVPAFLAMIAGIFLALILMKSLNAEVPVVDCSGDVCLRG